MLKPDPKVDKGGKFLCQVDAEHTARAVAAVRREWKRKGQEHLIELRK